MLLENLMYAGTSLLNMNRLQRCDLYCDPNEGAPGGRTRGSGSGGGDGTIVRFYMESSTGTPYIFDIARNAEIRDCRASVILWSHRNAIPSMVDGEAQLRQYLRDTPIAIEAGAGTGRGTGGGGSGGTRGKTTNKTPTPAPVKKKQMSGAQKKKLAAQRAAERTATANATANPGGTGDGDGADATPKAKRTRTPRAKAAKAGA